jgi:tetratricopeptide (TPR) repeat protein
VSSVLLIAATLTAFWGVMQNGFVNFDDESYVTKNPHVQAGITPSGLRWALTSTDAYNWHPLTWLSLQLDYQIYGLNPLGFHLTNLLLHVLNAWLLYWLLWRMTRATWRSALVAAFFALHPLHVESVAWAAERKDVLSTLLGFLTLHIYVGYVERPSAKRYLAVLLVFAFGLMAKPMLVTLPFILLLLDYWPLQRFSARSGVTPRAVLLEKVPLIALSTASCVVTLVAQLKGHSVRDFEGLPLSLRVMNAAWAAINYVCKMIWPLDLAVLYPLRTESLTIWHTLCAAIILGVVSAFAIRQRTCYPYLLVGWLWYLGTLVPVIGLVQVGSQSMADRYTYVPLIGVFLALVWWTADLTSGWRPRWVVPGLACVLLLACMGQTRRQVRFWHDDVTLWQHALEVTEGNALAHINLGVAFERQGDLTQAAKQLEAATLIAPGSGLAHRNLGLVLAKQGKHLPAIEQLSLALEKSPDDWRLCEHLAASLHQQGRLREALAYYSQAAQLNPYEPSTYHNMGVILRKSGRWDEAAAHFMHALQLDPSLAIDHYNLGMVYAKMGNLSAAVESYQAALDCGLREAGLWNELGVAYLRLERWNEAGECFQQALSLEPRSIECLCRLAGVFTKLARFDDARSRYKEALRLSPNWPQSAIRNARALATHPDARVRDGLRALELAQHACEATSSSDPVFLDTLAAAYAEAGQFPDAITTAEKALSLVSRPDQLELTSAIKARLQLYRDRRPFHDPAQARP